MCGPTPTTNRRRRVAPRVRAWLRAPLPPGPWRNADTAPLHGLWSKPEPSGRETVVVANHGHLQLGWQVPRQRWRFASELVRASNCAVAQVPWLWRQDDRLVTSDPDDVAVALVLAGRKPAAQAVSDNDGLADRWVDAAVAAGLAVRRELLVDRGPRRVHGGWYTSPCAARRPGASTSTRCSPTTRPACRPARWQLGAPCTSWAADDDGALMVELARAAARAGLPGLPSAFGLDRQGAP